MSLKLSKDDHTKTYAKSIKSLQKVIKKHLYISSLKFSLVKLLTLFFQFTSNSLGIPYCHYQISKYLIIHKVDKDNPLMNSICSCRWLVDPFFSPHYQSKRRRHALAHVLSSSSLQEQFLTSPLDIQKIHKCICT